MRRARRHRQRREFEKVFPRLSRWTWDALQRIGREQDQSPIRTCRTLGGTDDPKTMRQKHRTTPWASGNRDDGRRYIRGNRKRYRRKVERIGTMGDCQIPPAELLTNRDVDAEAVDDEAAAELL